MVYSKRGLTKISYFGTINSLVFFINMTLSSLILVIQSGFVSKLILLEASVKDLYDGNLLGFEQITADLFSQIVSYDECGSGSGETSGKFFVGIEPGSKVVRDSSKTKHRCI